MDKMKRIAGDRVHDMGLVRLAEIAHRLAQFGSYRSSLTGEQCRGILDRLSMLNHLITLRVASQVGVHNGRNPFN